MMNASDHVVVDELADLGVGLVDPERTAVIETHLSTCADCREQAEALARVSARLAAEPVPVMPAGVYARLGDVLAQESIRRRQAPTGLAPPFAKPTLGTFGAGLAHPPKRRWVGPMLAAAVAAVLVGFGGYVLSASAGLNEPPTVATSVKTGDLGPDAGRLRKAADLSPHRFSRAWQCARQVTSGRIVDLASTTVDGAPALLVYTRSNGVTQVTVVTGCDSRTPSAGPSAPVAR